MLHKNTENRRWQDHMKAKRKRSIALHVYGFEFYQIPGKYDKGKIHCSCPLCRAKTNKQKARVGLGGPGSKNWTISDLKKIEEGQSQMKELGFA